MSFYDIDENNIQVFYGMYGLREEREAARHSLRYILGDFDDIKTSYFRLGFHLDEFIRCKYYEDFGYLSFKEFALKNIPLDYSSINRCISVFNMSCEWNGHIKSNRMNDKYKNFSYSQLVEMVSMDSSLRDKISSDMSVRDIRDIKRNVNVDAAVISSVSDSSLQNNKNVVRDCDVAIDDMFLSIELADMIKKKYKNAEITQMSYTEKSIWFRSAGKQYKIMIIISNIKEC